VWEDTRYCDGVIPDESDYFLDDAPGKRIICRSGEPCPHSGRWATLAGNRQQIEHIEAGTPMPEALLYQKEYWAEKKYVPAGWSLLERDDGGNVYLSRSTQIQQK